MRTQLHTTRAYAEKGTPWSGPSRVLRLIRARSAAFASRRAASSVSVTKALSFGLIRSIRSRIASITSTGETFFRRISAASSVAGSQQSRSSAMPRASLCSDRVVSGREVEDHHLELRHLVDRVRRTLFAEPGLLEPAVGHPVGQPLGPPVDVKFARLDLAREPPRPLEVLGEDSRRESVVRVVRERDRLVDVVERRD